MHLGDLYAVQHVSGIWMALARSLNEGVFYPPLESDGCYAGTRYSPLFFVLIAGLSWLTPGYVAAAKLAAVVSVGVLVSGLFTAIRRSGGTTGTALVLACLPLACPRDCRPCCCRPPTPWRPAWPSWGLAPCSRAARRRRRGGLAAPSCSRWRC